jgi:hypothetical protein
MAESSDVVAVTEEMLIEAARTGDLESLTIWARRGVRVTSALPLYAAARGGHLEAMRCLVLEMGAKVDGGMPNGDTPLAIAVLRDNSAVVQCLVMELGADVNPPQAMPHGLTPLIALASKGHLADVRCIVELGAKVEAVDYYGYTALLASACCGQFGTMRYLLEEAGANLDDVNYDGNTIWGLLVLHFKAAAENGFEEDEEYLAALTGLLRVLVLRIALSPALEALLSPEPARVVQEGARLRAQLPAYLVRRRALLDAHCPVLLPPLRALVHGYMELTTTEELWATGLGQAE